MQINSPRGRHCLFVALTAIFTMIPVAAFGQDFEARRVEAGLVLDLMDVDYDSVESRHYHVLFVGKRSFAEERKSILEATRQNFIGFMRRLNLTVTPHEGKLLVILLDTQKQMRQFDKLSNGGDARISDWVAGYYDPQHNWAVFYNQRKGQQIKSLEKRLNRIARQLIQSEGGPDVVLRIQTENGPVNMSKRQIAQQLEAEWANVLAQMMEYNTMVTQHEGAHQIAYNVGIQNRDTDYPFWVSEGLACVFEVPPSRNRKSIRGAGKTNADRLNAYRNLLDNGKNEGLERMIAFRRPGKGDDVHALYAESWAMFAFFFHRHAGELSAYMDHLAGRRRVGSDGWEDEVKEFRRFFKHPLPALQREFDQYIRRLK
ncbi:MAG: DUF1570 domain-containing protein [Planctomycetota bacterium]|jgi:hypothetical protein